MVHLTTKLSVQLRQQKKSLAEDLLDRYAHMESIDVRDKTYGLLSLVRVRELKELGVMADYSKTPLELHEELLEARCRHYGLDYSPLEQFARLLQKVMGFNPGDRRVQSKLVDTLIKKSAATRNT